jgi:hypothetical protein
MALPIRQDYEVSFTREETIEDWALRLRRAAGNENDANFNIVEFVYRLQRSSINRRFKIELFDMVEGQKPAFVSYDPVPTLNIEREIWDLANIGDPSARFIVAHEICHLLFHDHHAKAFSNDPNDRIKRSKYMKEVSAEWQASTFADYLLLPAHLALSFSDAEGAMRACGVDRGVAERRFAALAELTRPRPVISGDFCIQCGEFVERRNDHRCK